TYADTFGHHLPSGICTVIVQCVLDTEFQTVHSQFFGELVVKLLLRDGCLRHAKTAERSRWNQMSVHGACYRAVVCHLVRSGSMYRYTAGYGRSPRRVGASVEFSAEIHRQQFAVLRRARFASDARRMALCRRPDGLRARVDNLYRTLQMPSSNSYKRLHGKVQFGSKTAANGGGNDTHSAFL